MQAAQDAAFNRHVGSDIAADDAAIVLSEKPAQYHREIVKTGPDVTPPHVEMLDAVVIDDRTIRLYALCQHAPRPGFKKSQAVAEWRGAINESTGPPLIFEDDAAAISAVERILGGEGRPWFDLVQIECGKGHSGPPAVSIASITAREKPSCNSRVDHFSGDR
jgi:hypothetical protein